MNLRDASILILEEQAADLQRLEHYLLEQGHAVLSASSLEAALDHLNSAVVIDLFLLDEQLAGPHSAAMLVEACLPVRPRMRVLGLSSSKPRVLDDSAPYPALLKPIRLDELERAIEFTLRSPAVTPWLEC
ncbi:response regulator [Pseudomonas sp. NY15437]|uniref:response regulator n=1 Tax=unclassified Pseudomonas TaxID=196821 RepID=UPI00223B8CA6|nr:response regulator [Pseudomonas sp. GCEP-101]